MGTHKLNAADIVWWPDDQKGLIINAVTARDRASWRFVARRAARLLFPLLPLAVAASFVAAIPSLKVGSPAWIAVFFDWMPQIALGFCGLMVPLIGTMLYAEWRKDSHEAAVLALQAGALGVDVTTLDSDWVFQALVLPMVRRKGVVLPDGSTMRLAND